MEAGNSLQEGMVVMVVEVTEVLVVMVVQVVVDMEDMVAQVVMDGSRIFDFQFTRKHIKY